MSPDGTTLTPEENDDSSESAAPGAAVSFVQVNLDALSDDLNEVISRWPSLHASVRQAILLIVQQSTPDED